jgi:hypothetical protein
MTADIKSGFNFTNALLVFKVPSFLVNGEALAHFFLKYAFPGGK